MYRQPVGRSNVRSSRGDRLGWKHNAFVTYSTEAVTLSLSQIYRNGYNNQALPGIANRTVVRPDYNPRVADTRGRSFSLAAEVKF